MNKLSHEKHQPKYIGQDMMEFLANAKFEDLPAEVVTRAKHVVMDAVAVMYAGRKSPNSLYSYEIATMEGDYTDEDYNQDDASGFIHLNGLRLKQFARVNH